MGGGGGGQTAMTTPRGVQSHPIPGQHVGVCGPRGKVKMPVCILYKCQVYALSGLRSIAPDYGTMAKLFEWEFFHEAPISTSLCK